MIRNTTLLLWPIFFLCTSCFGQQALPLSTGLDRVNKAAPSILGDNTAVIDKLKNWDGSNSFKVRFLDVSESTLSDLKDLAKRNDANAARALGLMYSRGLHVTESDELAIEYFKIAASLGSAVGKYRIGLAHIRPTEDPNSAEICKQMLKESFEIFLEEAKGGNADSQYKVGWCYRSGHGVKCDYKKAIPWYHKAAENGHADAQNMLTMYVWGEEKIKWTSKAAEQGHRHAQMRMGDFFREGKLVDRDDIKAIHWYRKAAENGYDLAQFVLARTYSQGDAIANPYMAKEYSNPSANVEKDYGEAIKWYLKAAEQNSEYAQFELAVCFEKGLGTEKKLDKAFQWYLKAAEQNHEDAQFSLANCYFEGKGVDQNTSEAIVWYKKAAAQRHWEAKRRLLDAIATTNLRVPRRQVKKWLSIGVTDLHDATEDEIKVFSLLSSIEDEKVIVSNAKDDVLVFKSNLYRLGNLSFEDRTRLSRELTDLNEAVVLTSSSFEEKSRRFGREAITLAEKSDRKDFTKKIRSMVEKLTGMKFDTPS